MRRYWSVPLLLALSAPCGAFNLGDLKGKLDALNPPSAQHAAAPAASGLDRFSTQEQVSSLKQALNQGAEIAVRNLSKKNGYLNNAMVHIPLPENLQKADRALRRVGLGKYSDELIAAMNHAAEAAVPEARTLLLGAVKNMTVTDAKNILLGKDDAATQFFRHSTEAALSGKFKPVVVQSMQKVSLARAYDRFAGKGVKLGLVDEQDAHLDDYITRKALDGLFLMMAAEEKKIRAHPLQATGDLARKVFAVLRGQ
ncbi:DUF4197 domain-containing protein [Ferrigenium sp. UT5]|uniref:DUF4197 domain-containing protein n=1 Tax=Ferrigenium sp. UT5 TaxID=3242105 RepID=UPI0038B2C1F9